MASAATAPHFSDYVIDQILPAREVHLLGGPSGAGKTTWEFQTIVDWSAGQLVCGMRSYPSPWLYVACDRSLDATLRTIHRVGAKFAPENIVSLVDHHQEFEYCNPKAIMAAIGRRLPRGGMAFLDGIASLVPGGKINDYDAVADFCRTLTRECKKRNLTILGTTHATKTKEGERFLNPRQRLLGSVAWGAYTETVILIEPSDNENQENGERTLLVLPRNDAVLKLDLTFDSQGRLIERHDTAADFILDKWLRDLPAGSEFITAMVHEIASNIPRRTTERWLSRTCDAGKIERTGKGRYKKVNPS